jgi:hypothetical protein
MSVYDDDPDFRARDRDVPSAWIVTLTIFLGMIALSVI